MSPELALPLDAVTQKLAFIGRTGSGKTYAATKLAELFGEAGAQFIALDPVGKWWSLRLRDDGKPSGLDVPVFGGLHGDLPLEPLMGARIADLIVDRQISAVLDVSQFEHNTDKARFAEAFATRLFYRKKSSPSAIHLFVEEAQEFIPQNPQGEEKRMLGAFERIVKLGRNFGIGASLISQRPQEINKKALNQTECLFVFQTTGTHERKAIDAWIADKGLDEDIAALLPSLHVGEARVWSPAWLRISLTTTISEKKTFDASATPKVGARKVEVKALTPIDIAEITKSLADVVERAKADDPRELKRRIADLEKRLKTEVDTGKLREKLIEATETKVVEKPVLTNKQVDDLAMVASKLDLLGAKLSNSALDVSRILKAFDESQRRVSAPGLQWSKENRARLSPTPSRADHKPVTNGSGEPISSGHRRILLALAQHGECSKGKLAVLTRYASNGGGFNNNLSALRVAGRIAGTDPLTITDAGLKALGGFDPLPDDAASLFSEWMQHPELGRAHRAIMTVLKEHGYAMSKEDIAAKCTPPYEPTGGGFINALSRLRTLGVIEGKNEIELTEQLRG
jgi:uncharacterized protein